MFEELVKGIERDCTLRGLRSMKARSASKNELPDYVSLLGRG
jgi:hypothetical protein